MPAFKLGLLLEYMAETKSAGKIEKAMINKPYVEDATSLSVLCYLERTSLLPDYIQSGDETTVAVAST